MNIFYMMIGLPGSGKSSLVKTFKEIIKITGAKNNSIIISTDEIRKEINGDENCQDNNAKVFEIALNRAKENIKDKNVIFDATNINRKRRMEILRQIKNCYKEGIFVYTPFDECLKRNSMRERKVPIEVIKRMYKNFDIPYYAEGFDSINIVKNFDTSKTNIIEAIQKLKIPHDNSHHRPDTILDHVIRSLKYYNDNYKFDYDLAMTIFLHDIGKINCKTFVNMKGEKTEEAHYYGHEKVGAYDSIEFLRGTNAKKLENANLIMQHMYLKQNLSEKTIQKFIEFYGKEFYEKLKIVNECDLNGG